MPPLAQATCVNCPTQQRAAPPGQAGASWLANALKNMCAQQNGLTRKATSLEDAKSVSRSAALRLSAKAAQQVGGCSS